MRLRLRLLGRGRGWLERDVKRLQEEEKQPLIRFACFVSFFSCFGLFSPLSLLL